MVDFAVIGAGVTGSLVARELTKYGCSVAIFEKENDVARGSSSANSGIVHAGFDAKEGSLKARLNVEGNKLMYRVCKELDVPCKNNGSLVVAFSEEEREHVNSLLKRGIANGVPYLRIVEKEELREMEPNISDEAVCALFAPTGGIVCPYSLAIAACGNAMDNGAELYLNCEITSITKSENGFVIRDRSGRVFEAGTVINAAGLYSDKIAEMAGVCDFTVTPRKGEYMLLDREVGGHVNYTVFMCPTKMGKGILVSPTVHGNLLLGPTSVDMEDKEDKRTTQEGLDAVLSGASKSIKNIPVKSVITSFTGLRSVGSTGDFIIEFRDGIVNLAGIESPGLTASPAVAKYVIGLLKKNGYHFTKNPAFQKKRMIYRAPEEKYNRIICRCETISEGEIISAIHTNPGAVDVDGVKKRTRAGMGRCQGGFCQPFAAEILARETGKNLDEITKSGGSSRLLFGKIKED